MRRVLGLLAASAALVPPTPLRPHQCLAASAGEEFELELNHGYRRSAEHPGDFSDNVVAEIDELIALRKEAKKERNYATADALLAELSGCYDVYVDDATPREWRAGAPPELVVAPLPEYTGPTSGGFQPVDEEAWWERQLVPLGKKALDAQREAYFALDGPTAQVWARAMGRDFFVGRVRGSDAQAALRMQAELVDWSARELHLPLGASRDVAYTIAPDVKRADVAAWEATPGREAQPALAAPAEAAAADRSARTAEPVGFLAAKSPLPPTTLGNLVKRWRTRGQSRDPSLGEMVPTGSAAGQAGSIGKHRAG